MTEKAEQSEPSEYSRSRLEAELLWIHCCDRLGPAVDVAAAADGVP